MRRVRHFFSIVALVLGLAGCVASEAPLLEGGKPLLGAEPNLQLYSLRSGAARDPGTARFRWNGQRYVGLSGEFKAGAFSIHPFEGQDLILQSVSTRPDHPIEYALARVLAPGVYLVQPIDESDADAATRARCTGTERFVCRIRTREELTAFARATAAKHHAQGGLAILLADDK